MRVLVFIAVINEDGAGLVSGVQVIYSPVLSHKQTNKNTNLQTNKQMKETIEIQDWFYIC